MKRLIILSYHALPMDVVSSYRVKGYCDHLASFGIFPTLITHRWELDTDGKWKYHEDDDVVTEKTDTCKIIRLPRKRTKKASARKIDTLFAFARGDLEADLLTSYHAFRAFLLDYLTVERIDALLVIYSPHFQMKLAFEMKQRFGIPYVTDFRDLWDNQIVTKSYSPGLKKKTIDAAIRFWWRRWIGEAEFFTTTGTRWLDFLERLSGKKGYIVRNGFESEYATTKLSIPPSEFIIVHFGRLYPTQDFTIFTDGYRRFLHNVGRGSRLEIIGNKPLHGMNALEVLAGLPLETWKEIPYMSKARLLEYCNRQASVLWMPGFKEDNGQVPVKVYDYLLLKKNILLAPGSCSDLALVIAGSGAGVACNTPDEVCAQLEQWYREFRGSGGIPYHGDPDVIRSYARVYQVRHLAEAIHSYIN